MGDGSDHADVNRFMRSKEGKHCLEQFRAGLLGKRIIEVELMHSSTGVTVLLIFDDGDMLDLLETINAFAVETLRERYKMVLDREYYVDFPGRQV